MARPPRIDFPNALYHVTSRGNGRREISWTDRERERFLAQLADGTHTFAVVLYCFVLLDNHFHLLVRTPRANLSRFMQRLCTSYALYARYKHRRPGHQFQGRFKAKLVEDETYLRALTRYIHLNPIKTVACRRLGRKARVGRLENYRWSSYPGYVDPKNSRYAIGSERFLEETARRLAARRDGRPQNADLDLPRTTVPIEVIDECVARHCQVSPNALQRRGAGAAKIAAVELACRVSGLTQRAIGMHYGGITSAAVSNIRRRLRQGDYPLSDMVEQLLRTLPVSS